RSHGGTMATAISIILLFTAGAAALAAASSSTLRSRLRLFISENFFNYKYDYRIEWGRFIASLSARDDDNMPLRVLRTLAELMDCPGGLLLLRRNGEPVLRPAASWSIKEEAGPLVLDADALAELERGAIAYVKLGDVAPHKLGRLWAT